MARNDCRVRLIPARHGYTLLEMLIVLAILAAVTGLSWPRVRGMLETSRLRSAAKQVRVALVAARLAAIESGTPQRVRWQLGSDRFEIGPLHFSPNRQAPPTGSRESLADAQSQREVVHFLPRGITFGEPTAPAHEGKRPLAGAMVDEEPGSFAIDLYPHGRTSQAKIVLVNESGLSIEVALRGLTGTTRIGPVQQRERQP